MIQVKHNVAVFDTDVRENHGYRYTTGASYSSQVANERMTRATLHHLTEDVESILDVGCGDGTYTSEIHCARPTLRLHGFDPATEAIGVARRRFPGTEFTVGNILCRESLSTLKHDLVIIRGVLHHLPDPFSAILNCRLLGERLLIIEPNGNNVLLKLIERLSAYHRKHEEQSFTSMRLKSWCQDAGYIVESVEFIGFIPFFFPTPLAKLIHWFQPILERIPLLGRWLGAQVVLVCRAARRGRDA